MKKFLVLALILVAAPFASATLVLDAPDAGTVNLVASGYETPGASFTCFMVYADVTFGDIDVLFNGVGSTATDMTAGYAGPLEGVLGLDTGAITAVYQVDIKDTDFVLVPNGTLVTSTVSGAGTIYLQDQSGMSTLACVTVPEPATMVILGLGGLLLRRKK